MGGLWAHNRFPTFVHLREAPADCTRRLRVVPARMLDWTTCNSERVFISLPISKLEALFPLHCPTNPVHAPAILSRLSNPGTLISGPDGPGCCFPRFCPGCSQVFPRFSQVFPGFPRFSQVFPGFSQVSPGFSGSVFPRLSSLRSESTSDVRTSVCKPRSAGRWTRGFASRCRADIGAWRRGRRSKAPVVFGFRGCLKIGRNGPPHTDWVSGNFKEKGGPKQC